MLVSYHNHTNWSDGQAPLAEVIAAARAAGLDELGISDHLTCFPEPHPSPWSMPFEFLGEYVRQLSAAAAAETSQLTIRLGIEVDFFSQNAAWTRSMLAAHPFDYVISSVHFADDFPIDARSLDWENLNERDRNEKWRCYWRRIAEMAQSGLGDIIGHLDLPKKFGFRPTVDLAAEEHEALEAIAAGGQALEINTAGWHVPAAEAYPSLPLLKAAYERRIPLMINADAHSPQHLTRDFDRARLLAREAGYGELVRFERRKMLPAPL